MPLLSVRDLTKTYESTSIFGKAGAPVHAVRGVSFDIAEGETLGLIGESGCGKSTTGRMILRLIEPTSGSVHFNGKDVLAAHARDLRALRREMQIVMQDPYSSLNPRMRVREIVTEPLEIHKRVTPQVCEERARELMKSVGLDASALNRYPHEFSGGQRQRISIARALCLNPRFLVLDEPVSALDVSVGAQVVNLLRDLQRERKLTYLFISHSMPIVRYLSDRIAVMRAGEIVEIGATEEITTRPRHEYTRQLLEATPELVI